MLLWFVHLHSSMSGFKIKLLLCKRNIFHGFYVKNIYFNTFNRQG